MVEATNPDLGLGSDLDASVIRSLQVAENRVLEAQWKAGSTGDPLLVALRKHIEFRYRGDSVAALSS